ncbi:MAG: winged helix-turn-helix transcriptional regulator [Candidatus Njordarchaeia archaeon]
MPIRGKVVRRVFEKSPKSDVWEGLVRKVRWGRAFEYKLILRAHWPEPDDLKRIVEEILRSSVITPTHIAQKYNIKVSTAKKILKRLAELGYLEPLSDVSDSAFRAYKILRRTKRK